MNGGAEKKLLPPAEFERFLEEEMSLAVEYSLPLTVVVIRRRGGWDGDSTWLALSVLRLADLATLLSPDHLASFLPNTGPEGARAIEARVRKVLPAVALGFASHLPDDETSDLTGRAREEADEGDA